MKNITRRFLLAASAAIAAIPVARAAAVALPPTPPPVPSWVPNGWLPCWGQAVSRKEYPRLFAAIGKTYGAPDAERFNLPDLRPELPVSPMVAVENIISTGKLDHVGGALPAGSVAHFAAPPA